MERVVTTGGRTKRRERGEHDRLEMSRGEIPWAVQSHIFLFLCYSFSLHFSSSVWIEGGLVRNFMKQKGIQYRGIYGFFPFCASFRLLNM